MKKEFIDFVCDNLNMIKEDFKIKISRIGLSFNEDIFSDTILKCNNTLKNRGFGQREMISYFWIAFKTNTLRDLRYNREKTLDYLPEIEDVSYDDRNDMFEEVSKMIINKFGEEMYELFSLHANGMKYNDILKITDIGNLKYKFRKIREYVRNNYKNKGDV